MPSRPGLSVDDRSERGWDPSNVSLSGYFRINPNTLWIFWDSLEVSVSPGDAFGELDSFDECCSAFSGDIVTSDSM